MKIKLFMVVVLFSLVACSYRPPAENNGTEVKTPPAPVSDTNKGDIKKGDFFREGEGEELKPRPKPLEGMSVTFAFTENPVSLDKPVITYTVANDSDKPVWLSAEPAMIKVEPELRQFYLDFNCVKTNTGMAFYPFSKEQLQSPITHWNVKEVKPGNEMTGAFELDLKRGGIGTGEWDVYALVGYSEEISIFSKVQRRDRVPLWISRAHTLEQSWHVTIQ